MPAQTHCAGKNRRQKRLPRCLFAGEYKTVSVVFPFGGHPWGQHRMDGDRWRRARAQRRRRCVQYTILCFKCKACRFLCFLWDASHQETRSPLGVSFCCQKETKDHQRRGLPPPCGIHPAVRGVPASSFLRPLAWRGHIDGSVILPNIPASLKHNPSTPRALPWLAAVPSDR